MKYVEFKQFTDDNGALPIYLFEGEEAYFREKGEALLKARFLQEPTLDYVSFDGAALKGEKMKGLSDAKLENITLEHVDLAADSAMECCDLADINMV